MARSEGNDSECSNCFFWEKDKRAEDRHPRVGECHRYPPTHTERPMPDSSRHFGASYFTRVNSDDWCGEWAYSNHQRMELPKQILKKDEDLVKIIGRRSE